MTRRAQTGRIQRHSPLPVDSRSMASAVPRSVRLGAFAALALVVGGVAIALVVSRLAGPAATDAQPSAFGPAWVASIPGP